MAADTSPTTGLAFYSGGWQDVAALARALKIGNGKMSQINQEVVNFYQEMVDREIDSALSVLYQTPFLPKGVVSPADGTTSYAYPGELTYISRQWAIGLLCLSEFQNLDPNESTAASSAISEAKHRLFALSRPTARLRGQEMKSRVSLTYPPAFQPLLPTELEN